MKLIRSVAVLTLLSLACACSVRHDPVPPAAADTATADAMEFARITGRLNGPGDLIRLPVRLPASDVGAMSPANPEAAQYLGGVCCFSRTKLSRQDEATTYIWNSIYGMGGFPAPPPIVWVSGTALNCGASEGRPGWLYQGGCVVGLYDPGANLIYSANTGNQNNLRTGSFRHELCHAGDQYLGLGAASTNHDTECFVPKPGWPTPLQDVAFSWMTYYAAPAFP